MALDFKSFIQLKKNQIARAQENSQHYSDLYKQSILNHDRENKVASYQKRAISADRQERFLQFELSFARPEIKSDIEERLRIIDTYPELINKHVSDDDPLFFHGVSSIAKLEDILSSGHLGYLEDEESRSFTTSGMLDVTTKDSIATSINGFTGLNCSDANKYLPAGCLIVVAPKDDGEKAYANQKTGSEHSIPTVDFENTPSRIVSIISTNENRNYVLELASKYHIDSVKVHTFDSFIEYLSQRSQSQYKMAEHINNNASFKSTCSSEVNAQRTTLQQDVRGIVRGADGRSY